MYNSDFTKREISWLSFNERVLMEATDESNPIMEQLKFIAIFSSNLDEFFMVRVAGIKEQVAAGYDKPDSSGMTPKEQLEEINKITHRQIELQQNIFKSLKERLRRKKVIFDPENSDTLSEIAENIFIDEIMSVITPVTLDPAHPFPFIFNKRISIIAELERDGKIWRSLIMIPENIRRFFRVRMGDSTYIFMTEAIIKQNIARLYKGFSVLGAWVFRITRDSDLYMQEEEAADDLLHVIQNSIDRRSKGAATRLETEPNMPQKLILFLQKMIGFDEKDLFTVDGTIDLTFLYDLTDLKPTLQFPPFKKHGIAGIPSDTAIFDRIKEKDIFFYRPYYPFSLVSRLIAIAASDPNVLAIKMTLYRTNSDSTILTSLLKAAKSGKQVSVVIELKARFDEERNIGWARNLEEAGCIVTYGIAGLKIHAKCLLIVRREGDTIKRYTHIATGNYNEITADIYTDADLITADEAVGRDAAQLFNYLMGYTDESVWRRLFIAPFSLRNQIVRMLAEEISEASEGRKARIIMKMNAITDESLISKMYAASNAGVKIDLIVRGVCGLKPQVSGLSENITVRSIVGRFLEHMRIFYFSSGGKERFFISSADMMPRNLDRRVELMVEINDEDIKKSLKTHLDICLADNTKAWTLEGDKYRKLKPKEGEEPISAQKWFMEKGGF